jgi:hypothetical protein
MKSDMKKYYWIISINQSISYFGEEILSLIASIYSQVVREPKVIDEAQMKERAEGYSYQEYPSFVTSYLLSQQII